MAKVYALTPLNLDGVFVPEGEAIELDDKRLAELNLIEEGLVSKAKPKAQAEEESE
jgi:hypothetical protein